MPTGNLFVVSGPSGAGKGTLVARLLRLVPDLWLSVSATTRAPREGETDGVSYRFMSVQDFEGQIAREGFLEWARYGGNYYGTPRDEVERRMAEGGQVVLEIDVQGALQVKERLPEARLVFIEPPSKAELERRLRARGTDSEDSIRRRMEAVDAELACAARYDETIVNDDLDAATERLLAFVREAANGAA